jgi:SSS family solute:Na+ symporter
VALLAGIISAIGYIGFTSSQVLAGAKLASATIDGLNIQTIDCYGRYQWPILPLED